MRVGFRLKRARQPAWELVLFGLVVQVLGKRLLVEMLGQVVALFLHFLRIFGVFRVSRCRPALSQRVLQQEYEMKNVENFENIEGSIQGRLYFFGFSDFQEGQNAKTLRI